MAAAKKNQKKVSAASKRGAGAAAKRTKRAAGKRTRRAARRPTKPIVQLRKLKAAKPTEDTPLPEPIATFTF